MYHTWSIEEGQIHTDVKGHRFGGARFRTRGLGMMMQKQVLGAALAQSV
jgi:hypothetical protein